MPSYRLNRDFKPERTRAVITIGDPFGIGPEITLKALAQSKLHRGASFLIIGDGSALYAASKKLNIDLKLGVNDHLYDLRYIEDAKIRFGRPSEVSGRASLAYIDYGLRLIKAKEADCLITAPVSKEAIAKTGIKFSGHTEYIAETFKTDKFAMMLVGGPLRVILVTRHISIREVPRAIIKSEILKCIGLSHKALKEYFGIKRPKIGVTGLNPHGGEGGRIGNEEERVIKPAVKEARRYFKDIIGPSSSEALFYEAFHGRLDCIIAMYHDQGLTPLKMVARDNSVNITLGLPFVRTSPGHGTAFDIAGKGIADARPMIEAIEMAITLTANR